MESEVRWCPVSDLVTLANSACSEQSWGSGCRIPPAPAPMTVQLADSCEVPGKLLKPTPSLSSWRGQRAELAGRL